MIFNVTFRKEDFSAALDMYQYCVTAQYNVADALNNMGVIYHYHLRNSTEALAVFHSALQIDPYVQHA